MAQLLRTDPATISGEYKTGCYTMPGAARVTMMTYNSDNPNGFYKVSCAAVGCYCVLTGARAGGR